MRRVLVDKYNTIVYSATDAKEILRILNADIYSVSEEDEIKYGATIRTFLDDNGECIYEDLKYEVHFDLKFIGIDDFYRPVFKDVDSTLYFGDVNKLWNYAGSGEKYNKLINYYKENLNQLEYFGDKFNCEPVGGRQDYFKFNIVE